MPGGPQGTAARAITSRTVYVRFHGGTGKYSGRYPDRVLDDWAAFLQSHIEIGGDVFAFFNNDIDAQAPEDARRLRAACCMTAARACGFSRRHDSDGPRAVWSRGRAAAGARLAR